MEVEDYFRESHQSRVTERAAFISAHNTLLEIEMGKRPAQRRRLEPVVIPEGQLDGLLFYKMITAWELWREIAMFL